MLLEKKFNISYFMGKVWYEVLLVTFFSTISYVVSLYIDLPDLPIAIPAFLGTAISLVLAFKLGQSYDRWWEARKVWGAIVNDSRSLIMQAMQFTFGKNAKAYINQLAFRQMAWNYCLGQSLRKTDPLEHVDQFITSNDLEVLAKHENKPLAILNMQSKTVAQLHAEGLINAYQQVQLDETLVRLTTSMGQAERIKNTIFPTTYRIYLHTFIYLFLILMSISLAEVGGLWQIAILTFMSIPFMFLERASFNLQNPFENKPTDIPVTSIARTIEINLRQLIGDEAIPEPIQPRGFYIM